MKESPLFLAIDQGGHASRAFVCDARGSVLAAASVGIKTHREPPDRVEHDAAALVASVRRAIADALAQLGSGAGRVHAAGLATQRSSIVCWDRESGEPLSPVISWQDRRAAAWLARLAPHAARVRELTGLVLSPHYGASKLRWCLDEIEDVRRAHRRGRLVCGPLASFLIARLTRERRLHVDPCNGSRTLLWDVARGDWSDELLALFGVPRAVLPPCGANADAFGVLADVPGDIPLTVCTGDQPAALFAFGVPDPALASVNAGTGAFVQCLTGAQPVRADGLLTSVAWRSSTAVRYVLEGTVNGAGSALAWAAETLGIALEPAFAALEGETAVPPLFLNGVSGLGAPYWVSDFPSRFVGDGTPHAKLLAVLESVAFLLRRNLDAMRGAGVAPGRLRLTGGLAASARFASALADLCELPVERPAAREATAQGLAFLVAGEPRDWVVERAPVVEPAANPALAARYAAWVEAMEAAVHRCTSSRPRPS